MAIFKHDWMHTRGIGYLLEVIGGSLILLILVYDSIMHRPFSLDKMAMGGMLTGLLLIVYGWEQIRFWAK